MIRLRSPDVAGRWCLAGAGAAGIGAAVGHTTWWAWTACALALAVVSGVALRSAPTVMLLGLVLLGVCSGNLAEGRMNRTLAAEVPEGPTRVGGRASVDARPSGPGRSFLFVPAELMVEGEWRPWAGPTLLVSFAGADERVEAGDSVVVSGHLKNRSGTAWGDPYAAILSGRSVAKVGGPDDPFFTTAARIRARVSEALEPWEGDSAGGLVAGFLIGATDGVSPVDQEALRLSGLSHFVAVSGSNVALFLTMWWVVVGPLAFGPRRRAIVGLVGIALFAIVTRWEPSVLRASVMAGLVLLARAVGFPLSSWAALGLASTSLLLVAPELVFDVGFQLSVAATLGVMTGADLFGGRLPRSVATTLSATVAAQVAVAPILLLRFGTVPLGAPLANLVAAPAVAAATTVGIVAAASGSAVLMSVAVGAARWVLVVAEHASAWPQLGPLAAGGVACLLAALAGTRSRPFGGVLLGVVLLVNLWGGPSLPERPVVVFLDIGQGDAILIVGEGGEVVLMDGGPDPVVLIRKLRQYGIESIDLMVLSHPHEDHLAGLVPVAEKYPVGMIWQPGFSDSGATFGRLMQVAAQRGIEVRVPALGQHNLGSIPIEVLGPLRRYAHPNDQSLVLMVYGDRVLLPGDIETIAQRELGSLRAEIMKVPHSGSITSDLEWLTSSRPETAVISVGPNPFGHPSPDVIESLRAAGAHVIRTDQVGDVVISLGSPRESRP